MTKTHPIKVRGRHLRRRSVIVGSPLERPRRSSGLETSHPDLIHSVTTGVDLAQLAKSLDCFVLMVCWLSYGLWIAV